MRVSPHLTPETVERSRELRRDATDAERAMWRGLRSTFPQAHFRRQAPINRYFADFTSHRYRLIVEVDGSQHAEAVDYDRRRTTFLNDEGYRVLRFWNNEVLSNLEGVIRAIETVLARQPSPPFSGRMNERVARRSRAPA